MAHSLLEEEELEHSRIFNAILGTDVAIWLFFRVVHAVILQAIDIIALALDELGELVPQLVKVVVHLVDLLLLVQLRILPLVRLQALVRIHG